MLPDVSFGRASVRDYLDIGCADGSITAAIGESLGLGKDHIFGCDVRDLPPEDEMMKRFQFKHYDGVTLPYCDGSFDVITVFMVLHHIPEIEPFLKEIVRVLRRNGVLIIREHNCTPENVRFPRRPAWHVRFGLGSRWSKRPISAPHSRRFSGVKRSGASCWRRQV